MAKLGINSRSNIFHPEWAKQKISFIIIKPVNVSIGRHLNIERQYKFKKPLIPRRHAYNNLQG